jgi:hypothetical protein
MTFRYSLFAEVQYICVNSPYSNTTRGKRIDWGKRKKLDALYLRAWCVSYAEDKMHPLRRCAPIYFEKWTPTRSQWNSTFSYYVEYVWTLLRDLLTTHYNTIIIYHLRVVPNYRIPIPHQYSEHTFFHPWEINSIYRRKLWSFRLPYTSLALIEHFHIPIERITYICFAFG